MSTQNTPEQWFQKLKEPYRSEAIANIDTKYSFYKTYPESLEDALLNSFNFLDHDNEKWMMIFQSICKKETTYLEPETLTPEQMESGKWYYLKTNNDYKFVVKYKALSIDSIDYYKAWNVTKNVISQSIYICPILDTQSIRHATKDEVLKYFPDEVFEPIELRPEDLVSGEVYKATDEKHGHWWIFQHLESNTKYVIHSRCIDYEEDFEGKGEFIANNFKYYHATPEEKKLLLGEETPHYTNLEELSKDYNNLHKTYSDLMAKYEELQDNYEKMELSYVNSIETQDAKYDALADRYTKLEAYNDELTERINQTETKNNQEKVYFYRDRDMENIDYTTILEKAITNSDDEQLIYEAICIGKKKSVLVSE